MNWNNFNDTEQILCMAGTGSDTLENPFLETLTSFLSRKKEIFAPLTKAGAMNYLGTYKATKSPTLIFNIDTKANLQKWIKDFPLVEKSSAGTLADDIVLLHTSILELINHHVMWLPYSALAEKQRLKLVVETMIKYNLELVNKDFDSSFIISSRDRGVLITALTLVKDTYPKHWALIAPIFKLEAEATPDEVWTEYEKIMESIHPATPDLTGSGIASGI